MTDFAVLKGLDPATKARIDKDFDQLRTEYSVVLGAENVEHCLRQSLAAMSEVRVPTFVPLLAQRFAREQLSAMAQTIGGVQKARPEVLFVDVRDAGRSQLAAAMLEARAPGRVHIRTAGTAPDGQLDPTVTAVMADRGIDLSQAYTKPLTDIVSRAADIVVTLGCPDAVPRYPSQQRYDWDIPDVAGRDRAEVDTVCAIIDRHLDPLVDLLDRP